MSYIEYFSIHERVGDEYFGVIRIVIRCRLKDDGEVQMQKSQEMSSA